MSFDFGMVNMPFADCTMPSLQCGTIHSTAAAAGFDVKSYYFNVELLIFLETRIDPDAIRDLHEFFLLRPDAVTPAPERCFDSALYEQSGGTPETAVYVPSADRRQSIVDFVRASIPEFLEHCFELLVADRPRVVGFTCTFQRVPQLLLAKLLKARRPDTIIVFGGSQMEGKMGQAFCQTFPVVDVVVRGEGEEVIAELLTDLCSSGTPTPQPGLVFRTTPQSPVLEVCDEATPKHSIVRELDPPNYDDYFERIRGTQIADERVVLPVETSRGCWWFKHKCKFCGRSEDNLTFRLKTLDQATAEFIYLAERHGVSEFFCVDPCVAEKLIARLGEETAARGHQFHTWCQGRVGLDEAIVRRLEGFVQTMFLGIESLSTPVLTLMRKGQTAIDCIRVLRYGAESGIRFTWNFLFGFPFEKEEHYQRVIGFAPALRHLSPPMGLNPLQIDRASVYFDQPDEHGVELLGPVPGVIGDLARSLGGSDQLVADLAETFRADFPRIDSAVITELHNVLEDWRRHYHENKHRLWCEIRSPSLVVLFDYRRGRTDAYELNEFTAAVYLACSAGATAMDIVRMLDERMSVSHSLKEVEEFLHDAVAAQLMYEEDGRFLALALLPKNPEARAVFCAPPQKEIEPPVLCDS